MSHMRSAARRATDRIRLALVGPRQPARRGAAGDILDPQAAERLIDYPPAIRAGMGEPGHLHVEAVLADLFFDVQRVLDEARAGDVEGNVGDGPGGDVD